MEYDGFLSVSFKNIALEAVNCFFLSYIPYI